MTVHHRIGAIVLVVSATVGVTLEGAGPAKAGEVTLHYQCSLPPFPAQGMTLRLAWNAPDSMPLGQNTPAFLVKGTAIMGDLVTRVLGTIGAATVEGVLDAAGIVAAPEGKLRIALRVAVPRTAVPGSGPITVAGSGTTPVVVFHQPGHAVITADSGFTVHIVPRDANGDLTFAGQLDASCTLDAGQSKVLNSFEITAPKKPRSTTTHKPTATTTPTTTASEPPVTADPSGTADPTPTTEAPGTGSATSTIPTPGTVVIGSVVRRAVAGRYVASGGMLVAGFGILGCAWWLRRRHQRDGRGR